MTAKIPVLPAPAQFDRAWASALVGTLNAWIKQLVFGDHVIQGQLTTRSGQRLKTTLVTAATYTVLLTDQIIDVNRAGAVTLTMPVRSADGFGQVWYVQDSSGGAATNNITINRPNSSFNINGGASVTLATNYGRLMIVDNATQYVSSA